MSKPRPSVGELVEGTRNGNSTNERVLAWFKDVEPASRVAITDLLVDYHEAKSQINRVTIYHTLASYAFYNSGLLASEHAKKMLTEASYIKDRIKRLEQVIENPEDVILRKDRSVNLGGDSCVLDTGQVEFLEFVISEEQNRGQAIQIGGGDTTTNLFPILNGNYSVEKVENGRLARWLVGKNTVVAQMEQWSCEFEETLEERQGPSTKEDQLMRFFNMYVDLLEDGNISDLLLQHQQFQDVIERHKELIYKVLLDQLNKQSEKNLKIRRIATYQFAFNILGKEELSDEMLCDILADETPDDEVTTSLLCEAA